MEDKFDQEEIKEYVLGQLSKEKEQAFEKRITEDEELADEVTFYKDILEVSEVIGDEDISKMLTQTEQELNTEQFFDASVTELKAKNESRGKMRVLSIRRIYAAAAAIVILIASWFVIQNFTGSVSRDQLFSDNFNTPPLESIITPGINKGGDPADPAPQPEAYENWEQSLEAYKNGNKGEALLLLEQTDVDQLDTLTVAEYNFFAAILYMDAGQYERSESFLEKQEIANPFATEWYRALLLLKQNASVEEIRNAFTKISQSTIHPWQQEAIDILEKLDKLKD